MAVNLAAFVVIEATSDDQREQALSPGHSGDLMEQALQYPQTQSRFDLYAELGARAPGSTLVLAPSAHGNAVQHVAYSYYLASPANVTLGMSEPAPALERWHDAVVASGEGGHGGPAWFVVAPEGLTVGHWTVMHREDPTSEFGYAVWVVASSMVGAPS